MALNITNSWEKYGGIFDGSAWEKITGMIDPSREVNYVLLKMVRWDRKKADDLFYDVLVADGVPKWRAYLAWSGVRLGGAAAWNAGGEHDDV